jgi:hypothetical protein
MVNTFLPFASIEASVRCLDNKRLGKQRVEAYQARAHDALRAAKPAHARIAACLGSACCARAVAELRRALARRSGAL